MQVIELYPARKGFDEGVVSFHRRAKSVVGALRARFGIRRGWYEVRDVPLSCGDTLCLAWRHDGKQILAEVREIL
jgi:hypothetical protein